MRSIYILISICSLLGHRTTGDFYTLTLDPCSIPHCKFLVVALFWVFFFFGCSFSIYIFLGLTLRWEVFPLYYFLEESVQNW